MNAASWLRYFEANRQNFIEPDWKAPFALMMAERAHLARPDSRRVNIAQPIEMKSDMLRFVGQDAGADLIALLPRSVAARSL